MAAHLRNCLNNKPLATAKYPVHKSEFSKLELRRQQFHLLNGGGRRKVDLDFNWDELFVIVMGDHMREGGGGLIQGH